MTEEHSATEMMSQGYMAKLNWKLRISRPNYPQSRWHVQRRILGVAGCLGRVDRSTSSMFGFGLREGRVILYDSEQISEAQVEIKSPSEAVRMESAIAEDRKTRAFLLIKYLSIMLLWPH